MAVVPCVACEVMTSPLNTVCVMLGLVFYNLLSFIWGILVVPFTLTG